MEQFSGKDRRVRARVALNGEVLGKIHTTAVAPVIDLSEAGALVEVRSVLRPGAVHTLRLPLAAGGELNLRARVVRSFIHGFERTGAPDETPVRYRAALEFIDLTEQDRAALREHVAQGNGHGGDAGFDVEFGS
jgi:hypothetical protein